MRLIAYLIPLILCAATLFSGCDQQMTKPVMEAMEVIKPPKSPLEKAQEAMDRINQRRTETHQKAEAADDFSIVFFESEEIFKEELGFRKGFWVELVEIYRDENSEDALVSEGFNKLQDAFAEKLEEGTLGMYYFEYIKTFDPLIVEYLRLSYVYPDMQEAELLDRFSKSVTDAKVSIVFPENF